MTSLDLLLTNVQVVRHDLDEPQGWDVVVRDGRVVRLEAGIDPAEAARVVDGRGRLLFPGVVDAHQHWGIYNTLDEDTATESRACAQGGVTSTITYMRTGQYYLNRGGPYAELFPEVLAFRSRATARSGRCRRKTASRPGTGRGCPGTVPWSTTRSTWRPCRREHIGEIPALVRDHGVLSFKVFMFYGAHGLHGRSADQSAFLMIPEGERYDYAHFEFVMRGIQAAREQFPELADEISLSLHCETAEIMTAYTAMSCVSVRVALWRFDPTTLDRSG